MQKGFQFRLKSAKNTILAYKEVGEVTKCLKKPYILKIIFIVFCRGDSGYKQEIWKGATGMTYAKGSWSDPNFPPHS